MFKGSLTALITPFRNGKLDEEAFRRFQAAEPEPKTELESVNDYTLLVAVVLSAFWPKY